MEHLTRMEDRTGRKLQRQHKMMGGIVAFELKVLDMQCKVKLNQHRPEAQAGMRAAYEDGTENERALAEWMQKVAGPH